MFLWPFFVIPYLVNHEQTLARILDRKTSKYKDLVVHNTQSLR